MHLGLPTLARFFAAHREQDALVLATVIAIEGSSYRKPGAMMLIAPGGEYAGMISGGCLEDDLLLTAGEVFGSAEARLVSYDTRAEEDLTWGLGLGCEGVVHLLLKRLDREPDFRLLEWLFDSLAQRVGCVLALVTRSEAAALPPGSLALLSRAGERQGEPLLAGCLDAHPPPWAKRARHHDTAISVDDKPASVLLIDLPPVPRVLVCGAGPDALPISRLAAELGWECLVVDHRPAYARPDRFPAAESVLRVRPGELGEAVDLTEIDAAVVMSHHLERDATYLERLLAADVAYVGLLGPRARRQQIERRLGGKAERLHGPVGLDIGAELPAGIALATVAEIHAVLNGRAGGMLSAAAEPAPDESPTTGEDSPADE